jgi:hypothetical protein
VNHENLLELFKTGVWAIVFLQRCVAILRPTGGAQVSESSAKQVVLRKMKEELSIMGDLLSHLGRDTLPQEVIREFVHWCVWQQARQALVLVLEEASLTQIAESIQTAEALPEVTQLSEQAKAHIDTLDRQDYPRGLSAAEGAVFEFINMAKSAEEATLDVEAVSFFASRVCGWAGWAVTGFNETAEKSAAESAALQAQEAHLEGLLKEHQSTDTDNN